MGRRESRDVAVKLVYQYEFHKGEECTFDDKDFSIDNMIKLYSENAEYYEDVEKEKSSKKSKKAKDLNYSKEFDFKYAKDITEGALRENAKIDDLINRHAKGWTVSRMARLDVAILRVAVYEMLYRPDIPFSVTINEAVELAKTYSHKDAGGFVNGILASICDELDFEK